MTKAWQMGSVLASGVLVLDQLSKKWVWDFLAQHNTNFYEVTSFFNLVKVFNKGVSFGLLSSDGQHAPWLLIAVASALSIWLFDMMRRSTHAAQTIACGLILGGAIGNVIDRIRIGAVFDFLDFHWLDVHFWAFNVADTGITVGATLLLLLSLFPRFFGIYEQEKR